MANNRFNFFQIELRRAEGELKKANDKKKAEKTEQLKSCLNKLEKLHLKLDASDRRVMDWSYHHNADCQEMFQLASTAFDLVLEQGANASVQADASGLTLLHMLPILYDRYQAISDLLEKGVKDKVLDLEAKDRNNQTALQYCLESPHRLNLAACLAKLGANFEFYNSEQQSLITLLKLASKDKLLNELKVVLEKTQENSVYEPKVQNFYDSVINMRRGGP